jgi:hypothetical protein
MLMEIAKRVQNEFARRVLHEFPSRFAPFGRIVWLREGGLKPVVAAVHWLRKMRLSASAAEQLPNIVIRDAKLDRLWLVDVPALGCRMTSKTRDVLSGVLANASERLLFANALEKRRELPLLLDNSLWGTVAWFAEAPDHLVIFDDSPDLRLLGPASNGATNSTTP